MKSNKTKRGALEITSSYFIPISIFLFSSAFTTNMAGAGTIAPSASARSNFFARELLTQINTPRSSENVVISPISIEDCLLVAYMGAGDTTAEELRNGLKLGVGDKLAIAQRNGITSLEEFKPTRKDGPQLRMANQIFVNENLQIAPKFNEIVEKYFESKAVNVKFADAAAAVHRINSWVEEITENKIQNLLQSDAVNEDTSLMLVNAIYFKGLWMKPFSESSTHKQDFFVNANDKVTVDMMYAGEKLRYADLPDFNAKALEMPYKNSELSMLLILPNAVDGLQELEQKLAVVDYNEITSGMKVEDVDVLLPKFKIEFDIDLKEPLQRMGMTTLFSNNANFSNLLVGTLPQKVSQVKHKAVLDVNEAGSEAAAATFVKIVPMSLNLDQKSFIANHPFVFAIRSRSTVYFSGHVAKF